MGKWWSSVYQACVLWPCYTCFSVPAVLLSVGILWHFLHEQSCHLQIRQCFSSFFAICTCSISSSPLMELARTPSEMLNGGGGSRRSCLVPSPRREASNFSPCTCDAMRVLYRAEDIPPCPWLAVGFYHEWVLGFVKGVASLSLSDSLFAHRKCSHGLCRHVPTDPPIPAAAPALADGFVASAWPGFSCFLECFTTSHPCRQYEFCFLGC